MSSKSDMEVSLHRLFALETGKHFLNTRRTRFLSLQSAIVGGDLTVVDSDAALLYDTDYEETLSFFEFANIEQLELRFFDRLLDQQLNVIFYEG